MRLVLAILTVVLASGVASADPLSFTPYEINSVAQKNVSLAAGGSYDLLNISPGTPGDVDFVWLALNNNMKDGILSFYVDGETTPSVTFDVQSMLGSGVYSGRFQTDHVAVEMGSSYAGYTFRYPVPYKSSIRISYAAPNSAQTAWSEVRYKSGESLPYKLHSQCLTFPNRYKGVTPAQLANGSITSLNLPSGHGYSGWVVYDQTLWYGATDFTYLETAMVAYLDGLTPGLGVAPQYDSSGSEDYYTSVAYFQDAPWSGKWTAVSEKGQAGTYSLTAAIDFLSLHGGIKFNDGILMRFEAAQHTGGAGDTNVDIAPCVLYYLNN